MTKYRVVLDTNIYRSNPRRDNLPFSALSRLCKADVVQLFVPYIVLREFQTQQSTQSKKQLAALVAAARSLGNQPGTPDDLSPQLAHFVDQLTAREAEIAAGAEDYFLGWIKDNKAEVIDLSASQAQSAMEAYFVGGTPLKEPKVRSDIPDALIFQAVRELASSPLTFVCEDEKLRNACAVIPGVTVFSSLPAFIESAGVQDEIKELDVIQKIGPIVSAMEKFEEETAEFTSTVRNKVGESLMWKKIESRSIPDDNHEATISSYSEPEDIEIDFDEAAYFGDGEFGIPFRATLHVTGFYYLFKGDVYRSEGRSVSLSDHNDHYYEAEEQFEVAVKGLVKVICDRDAIDPGEIDAAITDLSIDSLGAVQLVDEE
jgi:PIN domain